MKTTWDKYKLKPKVFAAFVAGAVLYGLNGLGVDVGSILGGIADEVGVDLPDEDVLATGLVMLIAAWFKKDV